MISRFAEIYRETCMRMAERDAFYARGGVDTHRVLVASTGGSVVVTITKGGVEVFMVNEDHDPGDED